MIVAAGAERLAALRINSEYIPRDRRRPFQASPAGAVDRQGADFRPFVFQTQNPLGGRRVNIAGILDLPSQEQNRMSVAMLGGARRTLAKPL